MHFVKLIEGRMQEVKGKAPRVVLVAVCRMWPSCPSHCHLHVGGC